MIFQTLEKPIFYKYMKLSTTGPGAAHATSIIAWWNTILYLGGFLACISYPAIADRYGRRSAIALGAIVSIIGAALQTGSINTSMMIVARLIIGCGMGVLLPAVPLYQAEIAPPSSRGIVVGIHGKLMETYHMLLLK
jgi:MFS family permease